jgi:hypothetical protein
MTDKIGKTVVVLLVATSCGTPEDVTLELALAEQSQELTSSNGLSYNGLSANGLSYNGLSANGLSYNGLSYNGLSANGLSSEAFAAWFAQDPSTADRVMRYLVRCAVPAWQTRSHTDPQTGQHYTWIGLLGLAPGWASGAPANKTEQQVITACLLAHVNRYGASIPISVLGRDAEGDAIPYSLGELMTYSAKEACFFGNLFTQEGLFFGIDRLIDDESAYLTRACSGLGPSASKGGCAPLEFIGSCAQSCTPDLLGGPFYWTCTHNGVRYRALSTRMRQSDYAQLFED